LRLYPVFPQLEREALNDVTFPVGGGPKQEDPVFVPKGTRVLTGYHALHRDLRVFGDDVEAFSPDRWESIAPTQWQFLPFGAGGRACLAREKALVEAAFVLARVAFRFETLESRDSREWKGAMRLNCQNAHGCLVSLRT
jgi:cytochrome P450